MDFFAQQDIARRNSRLLVVGFLLSVALLVMLTNIVVVAFLFWGDRGQDSHFFDYFNWSRFGHIGLAITTTIAMVVLFKWIALSGGGKSVAEGMGGARVLPQTRDTAERRCLNIVDEIALAANMPVPAVYVLNRERGINAFAAGITPADAIVAVTRGAIENLERDELQGVIAHEFSHILNGDMRLNIRLAAMLKGITFVRDTGEFLMHSGRNRVRSGNRGNENALPLLGLALWLLGWLGGLAAGGLKSAISRQREFLADASAVQYTRDNVGIANALKVIGGYVPGTLVHAARAGEMSHIFFGQIEHSLWHLFPTHPPLDERIRRLQPDWDGGFIERKPRHYRAEPSRPGTGEVGVGRAALVAAAAASAFESQLQTSAPDADFPDTVDAGDVSAGVTATTLPISIVQYTREPLGAQAIIVSLLISDREAVYREQLEIVGQAGVKGLEELACTVHPSIQALGAPNRLPLLELCLPSLRSMSARQYREFKQLLLTLIRTDRETALHEWCLYQLLRHYLDPEFVRVRPSRPRYRSLEKVRYHLRVALSVLAYAGRGDPEAAFRLGADALLLKELAIQPQEETSVASFSRAVHELADCYPLLKPRVLKAMARVAQADGSLNYEEREIIASLAAVMDCPQPTALKTD
ncbi:MAG: M48 family metallopeptidase [Pseudomonadota bacterium]